MINIKDIIEGHINELKNSNEEIRNQRMDICKKCPLFKEGFIGYVCNNNLYLNPETNEISKYKKDGFFKGCGCRLEAKTRNINNRCPINKW